MRSAAIGFAAGLLALATAHGDEVELQGITAIVRKHFPEGSRGGLALLVTNDNAAIQCKGYGLK